MQYIYSIHPIFIIVITGFFIFGLAFIISGLSIGKVKRRYSFFGYSWLVWFLLLTAAYAHSILVFDSVELPISFYLFVSLIFPPISIIANLFGLIWIKKRFFSSERER
ncbi:hypothetical protein DFR44_12120 [Hydromonas duriensis]|uniref:Uncharacterized protein n=1 Tax=Hydromonas duriensis TaxID=1527608 RepID=A0A4R6Y702_9BURK|nr:hypothetical protein DFR44_12120 [Hydromonas duriensis]